MYLKSITIIIHSNNIIYIYSGDVPSSWKSMMTERSKFPVNTVFLKFIGIQSESHYAVEQLTHVVKLER